MPLDGASGDYEWDGYIPFDQLPNVYNPPSGIIATANQNPFPRDYPYRVEGSFADRYRVEQIRALLNAKPQLTVNDILAVQKDVYSAYDHFLAQQVVAAFDKESRKDDLMRQSIDILRHWNGQMDKDQAAPLIIELFSNHLRSGLVKLLVPQAKQPLPDIQPRPQVAEELLRARPAGWIPKDDWDGWLLDSLNAALQDARTQQGSPPSKWHWGKALEWDFEHPVGKQLPVINTFFDMGPIPMSGSGTTVKQTTTHLGPSERMVVDLGDLDKSVQNLVMGESGFVASGHYKDQWQAYYVGRSFPMEFDHIDAKETLAVTPAP